MSCIVCRIPAAAALLLLSPLLSGASLVLTNGNIYTVEEAQPRAQAVVVEDGRITFVGDSAEALRRAPAAARQVDLQGLTVLPGLTDAHAHLYGIGKRELSFNLEGTAGIEDLQERLSHQAEQTKGEIWIVGRGWIESRWQPARFPDRHDLDAAVSDRPVLLVRADGHGAVANSAALVLADIDAGTPDPAGGQILKDERTGEPTGMLIDGAIGLVQRLVPPPDQTQILRALELGARRSVEMGWTQLHIAGNSYKEVRALRQLCEQDKISLRLYDAIGGPGADANRLLASGASLGECGGRLDVRGIKLYIDGALGSRGAALLAPYSDAPDNSGLLVNEEKALYPVLVRALRSGIQVQMHAIGDRGNRIALDLYERAFAAVPVSERAVAEPRWRIEHAQVVAASDIPRFAELGVIASMQPSHAIGDLFFAPARLGPARLQGAYAWRSLLEAGATLVGGSDAPVERGDPMVEFYAAVVRRSLEGFADENWGAGERLSREQALHMFTLGPAYAAFQEDSRGSIAVGKAGDFTVLSADIMQIPGPQILQARAVMTIIGGQIVYSRAGQP